MKPLPSSSPPQTLPVMCVMIQCLPQNVRVVTMALLQQRLNRQHQHGNND